MDKKFLVEQLADQLRRSVHVARRAGEAAAEEARSGATPAEKREDARVALEYASLARGQAARSERARVELTTIEAFVVPRVKSGGPVALGAVVEVEGESESGGAQGRTFFFAPAGAGVELTGPGGDGILSVVTPQSPIGRAVMGRRVGDTVEVTVQGEAREWTITYVE